MEDRQKDRVQALEALLTHPGWLAFLEHVHQEWGPSGARYTAELDRALDLTDSDAAASQARQVRAGRRVIEMLMAWPAEEIARVTRMEQKPTLTLSRRGGL